VNISIFGLGYVGAVSLACLARDGHTVTGVDVNPGKLELISSGISPVIEEGMPELMKAAVASGRVIVTPDVQAAICNSELSFITVGTPSAPNGSIDLSAVLSLTRSLATVLAQKAGYHVFVYRSTLTPGTTEETLVPLIESVSGKKAGVDFDVCFQPEFLREGTSIRDYGAPPFVVVGATSPRAVEAVRALFEHLPAEFHITSIRTAEMLKVCCNNFHAVKITFANEMARLCESTGCDPFEVMELVCKDRQLNISPAYLKPGFAFGGSCLPKDLRSSLYLAKMRDTELPMLGSVLPSNRTHIEMAISKVLAAGKQDVGMIGLSFKTGTDDLRESPIVAVAEQLLGKGVNLSIYDPDVSYSRLVGANRQYIEQTIPHLGALLSPSYEDVIARSRIIIIGINNRDLLDGVCRLLSPAHTVVDLAGGLRSRELPCRYIGASWQ
jgi:GDP-mannose 6-dehydrogenase